MGELGIDWRRALRHVEPPVFWGQESLMEVCELGHFGPPLHNGRTTGITFIDSHPSFHLLRLYCTVDYELSWKFQFDKNRAWFTMNYRSRPPIRRRSVQAVRGTRHEHFTDPSRTHRPRRLR